MQLNIHDNKKTFLMSKKLKYTIFKSICNIQNMYNIHKSKSTNQKSKFIILWKTQQRYIINNLAADVLS